MRNSRKSHQFSSVVCRWLVAAVAASLFTQGVFAEVVRVPEDQARHAILQKVSPTYPALARQMRLSGQVVLDMYVDESGSVEKADVVSGNPILGNAAVAAAKRWKFQPFQEDGKVTKAVVRIAFDFN